MKINTALRYQVGVRAGLKGVINEHIRDPDYLAGAANGFLRYARFIESDKDHHGTESHAGSNGSEPPLRFRGLMTDVPDGVMLRRPTSRRPDLSEMEGSTPFEAWPDLSYGAAV